MTRWEALQGGAPPPNSQDINSSTDPPDKSWEFFCLRSTFTWHARLTCCTLGNPLLGNEKGIRRYLHVCFPRGLILLTSCQPRLFAG